MRKYLAVLALAALVFGSCSAPATPGDTSTVTGVTITGTGITGTGGNKELTVTIGTPVDLGVTVVKSGNPNVTETWTSEDANTVSVVGGTGVVSGLVANATGVVVTVKVGGKSDTILVKVVEPIKGLALEFDTDKLEFQTITTTDPITAGAPVAPTVVKGATGILTLTNTDGTYKNSSTAVTRNNVSVLSLQGSSFLLLQAPQTGNFEIRAAVRLPQTYASGDAFSAGLGFFTTDANGKVALDAKAAVMSMRAKSVPDLRSQYSKSNTAGGVFGAGNPSVTSGVDVLNYRIFSVKRLNGSVIFEQNGVTASVLINTSAKGEVAVGGSPGPAYDGEIWSTLNGSVKVGVVFAGVQAAVEGLKITALDNAGAVTSTLYSAGTLPSVPFEVASIDVTGPGTAPDNAATLDLAGATFPVTRQLTTAYVPSTATVGNTVTYAVSAGDSNVTVDAAGLVSITGTGDGSATITATSGNAKTDTYVLTLIDSSKVVTGITIPGTLDIAVGQSKTLSPVTVLPASVTDKTVTWSSDNAAIVVNATTGAITVTAGTATGTTGKIKATSTLTPAVSSNECVVTVVAPTTTTKSWNFQQLPAGWTDGTNTSSAPYPADVDYGQGLTLKSSTRTMKILAAGVNPTTATPEFTVGYLQPGGTGVFASLGTITGSFSISIYYSGTGASSTGDRIPQILVDGVVVASGTAATVSTEGKAYTYNYTGTGGAVTLSCSGNALRIYDLSLTN